MEEQIKKWKEQYGSVFRQKINDVTIYFRQFTAKEFEEFAKAEEKNDPDIEIKVARACLLHPLDLLDSTENKSMIWEAIYQSIKVASIYDHTRILEETKKLRERRDTNVFKLLMANIVAHLPSVRLDELDKMNIDQLLEMAVFAEYVPISASLTREDIIKDPEEEKKRQLQESMKNASAPGGRRMNMNQKKFTNPAVQFQKSSDEASESLRRAMAEQGVHVKPISEIHTQKADTGSLADKIRSLNREIDRK